MSCRNPAKICIFSNFLFKKKERKKRFFLIKKKNFKKTIKIVYTQKLTIVKQLKCTLQK